MSHRPKTIQLRDRGGTLTDLEVRRFEAELGVRLPEQYRAFLMSSNGGLPVPNIIDVDGAPGSPTDVQVFFGVRRPVESSELAWNLKMFAERIPDYLLPIACDSGGNLFCIWLKGPEVGRIVYVDLDVGEPSVYSVAPDFDQFFASLREFGQAPVQRFEQLDAELTSHPEGQFGSGATSESTANAEAALGLSIRGTYRLFLERFGWGGVGAWELFGLGDDVPSHLDLVEVVKSERSEAHPRLPAHLLAILNDGYGNLYCLDTRYPTQPVVLWDHEQGEGQEPEKKADDFVEWLFDWMRAAIPV